MHTEKQQVRRQVKALVNGLSENEKTNQTRTAQTRLYGLPQFRQAESILIYWSLDDEIKTHAFIEKLSREKEILLPVIDGDTMRVKRYTGTSNMKPDERYNIPEPVGDAIVNPTPDLVLVPGVAFDSHCLRLGRGKGYYDQFLSHNRLSATLVGIGFNEQMVTQVPSENHDFPLDIVVTADRIYFRTGKKY
ncbi:MAG: 5-formyltetrahydrofolate cyclo-ligase [Salinivirgaceae bacterium]|jgi:5-formyltetrahydrofolate cyclo-ligase|nr:5-formyltetrahydrofolate cyclo-ligase [Salinivirgaceae bacterium]